MKYYITTFGCQANKADSERIERRLEMMGHEKTSKKEKTDLMVINACSVRQAAVDRVYAKVLEFQKQKTRNRKLEIILAGCLLESDKKKLRKKVDEIWHPDEYFDLRPVYSNHISACVPIMTGCDNFCTYCAVPHTRGRERSRPTREILQEVQDLVKKRYKEIWLIGQNVNSYKSGRVNFPKLLRMLNDIPVCPPKPQVKSSGQRRGKFWIRFTSPHPKDFSDELIRAIAECQKVAKYINLPIQSGDNQVLRKMNRNYTRGQYVKLINKIRQTIPEISISTDTIVGFPDETKKQFQNTVNLYEKLKFDMAFIAKYSPRPGTTAALNMEDNVPMKEKERRRKKLTKILEKTALENNKKLIGKTLEVLIDSQKEARPPSGGRASKCYGRTEGNKVVEILSELSENRSLTIGRFVEVKITVAEPWKLKGVIAKPKIIVILGPTASGKSELAISLAKKISAEIISADSKQVYKDMDIGTGKITSSKGIPHHLLDVTNPKKVFTAAKYKKLAEKALEEIQNKDKIPIVCGGTGFYIHTLLSNIDLPKVKPDWNLRKKLEKKSAEKLFETLKKLDNERAQTIDPKNKHRLIRALEIVKTLGKVPSQKEPNVSKYDVLWLGVKRSEKDLKSLIQKRVKKMLERGLLQEIKKLHNAGISWKKIDEMGFEYKYPALYIRGETTYEEMYKRMLSENFQYAKRQMTWFKKYAPETHWISKKKEAVDIVKKFLNSSA